MLIEARLTWDGNVIAVAHVPARGAVSLDAFGLPGFSGDRTIVFVAGDLTCDAVDIGGPVVWLSLTSRAPRPAWGELGEFRTTKGVLLAAVLHATLLAMAFIGREAPSESERVEVMKTYLAASEARFHHEEPPAAPPEPSPDGEGVSAKPSEIGKAGNPMQTRTAGLHARSRGTQPLEMERRKEIAEAREFGMIGLLAPRDRGRDGGSDPFASFEGPSAVGSIFGTQVDDSFGFGGAGLSGVGVGGGGQGAGIALATSSLGGTCGAGPCAYDLSRVGKSGQGFGVSGGHGRLSGTHTVKSLVACRCDETQVNGRLPPETVQRIVRQSFGRMRLCYEAGLVRNPSLEGRIAVKFVIDRSGAVVMASTAERSLGDSDVAACVERAFRSMSFPEPEGGIVTVVYPLVLST